MIIRLFIPVSIALLFLPFFASASTCPNLTRNLSFGSRGQDVVELQTFLIAQGDLAAGNNTGYFGRLTESAVKKWQAKNGVVSSGSPSATGYGAVGPKTRAAIARVCGGGRSYSSSGFTVTPTSGDVPLTVTATIGSGWGCPPEYTLEWGDGAVDVQEGNPPGTMCTAVTSTFYKTHTYTSPGKYTAKFTKKLPGICLELQTYPPTIQCDPAKFDVSTVTITVTGASVGREFPGVRERIARDGVADVIMSISTAGMGQYPLTGASEQAAWKATLRQRIDAVTTTVPATWFTPRTYFDAVPGVVGRLYLSGYEKLRLNPDVTGMQLNDPVGHD